MVVSICSLIFSGSLVCAEFNESLGSCLNRRNEELLCLVMIVWPFRSFESFMITGRLLFCYFTELCFVMGCCIYLAWNVMSIAPYAGGPTTFCSVLCQWSWHFVASCEEGGTILRLRWYQFWVMCNSLCCFTGFLFIFTYLAFDCRLLHLCNGINSLLT